MSSFPRARAPPAPSALRRVRTAASNLRRKLFTASSLKAIAIASVFYASVFFAPDLYDLTSDAAASSKAMLSKIKLALSRPIINDVSTDLVNPPAFPASPEIGAFPERNKEIIKRAYPELKPLVIPSSSASSVAKSDVFDALEEYARSRDDWEVTDVDSEAGTLQGIATTKLLKFKDDFVFLVSSSPDSDVVVDARSKSRVGKGDLGANAARIEGAMRDLRERVLVSSESKSTTS